MKRNDRGDYLVFSFKRKNNIIKSLTKTKPIIGYNDSYIQVALLQLFILSYIVNLI
jgi:hypothetical protein